jgi:MoaA/NifB/PqqE/SkfB family radical SAM enzyme
MNTWQNIRKIHIEISANCNAACPMCARYPTASYYVSPTIQDDWVWTLEQVEKRLPANDIAQLREILINGTVGDFITNPQGLEILKYLSNCAPTAAIILNTNGSARSTAWWKEMATIPNLTVNFAIDGLEDTHHLYRRNTNWTKIISNASEYIKAGGRAQWTMIGFKHNLHQIDACRALSKEIGFAEFLYRNSDRPNIIARDRNGSPMYVVKSPDSKVPDKEFGRLSTTESLLKEGKHVTIQTHSTKALPDTRYCESLRTSSIYIGSNWSVMPCCFFGAISINKSFDARYENFLKHLTAAGFTESDFVVSGEQTVKNIVDKGFDWVYDKLLTDDAPVACYTSCHPKDGAYQRSWIESDRVRFDGTVVRPRGIEPVTTDANEKTS